MNLKWILVCALASALFGCNGDLSGSGQRDEVDGLVPETKRLQRLTANQLFMSLRVATGQTWSQEDRYAATLGRPNFDQQTEEAREFSVSFTKLVGDAARETCGNAVNQDLEMENPNERVILKRLTGMNPLDDSVLDNLRYLMLRFHGIHVTDALDSRLEPWVQLVRADLPEDEGDRERAAQDRWKAVCVGLVLHPDFLTY